METFILLSAIAGGGFGLGILFSSPVHTELSTLKKALLSGVAALEASLGKDAVTVEAHVKAFAAHIRSLL